MGKTYGATVFQAGEPEVGIPHFTHWIDFGLDQKTVIDGGFDREAVRGKIKDLFLEILDPDAEIFVTLDDECPECGAKRGLLHKAGCLYREENDNPQGDMVQSMKDADN